jgi:hypothetical protein
MPTTTRKKPTPAAKGLYQLKITLCWSQPSIWRRVLVRADTTLDHLNHVIQLAMGWTNSHMHQFIVASKSSETRYGHLEPRLGALVDGNLDESRFTLSDIAPAVRKKFFFEYDFGDSWEHEVVVEKILPFNPELKHSTCLAGERACPPEDCGGIPGYESLLEVLADPEHSDYEEMKDWVEEDFDPEAFDLKKTNAILKKYKV